jgi:hypothetical protein
MIGRRTGKPGTDGTGPNFRPAKLVNVPSVPEFLRETWIGRVAGTMAMEQLSALFARRRRSRASECGMGKDLVPGSRRIKVEPKNPRSRQHRARPCKKRKSAAPTVLMMPARSKARATRQYLPEHCPEQQLCGYVRARKQRGIGCYLLLAELLRSE